MGIYMFTGIIEGLGTIAAIQASGKGRRLTVTADFDLLHSRVGDSIAVNGACLTAVEIGSRRFVADVSPETLDRTTFGKVRMARGSIWNVHFGYPTAWTAIWFPAI